MTWLADEDRLTIEELYALPARDDDGRQELLDGYLLSAPPGGPLHGMLVSRVGYEIHGFVKEHNLGYTLAGSGVVLSRATERATVLIPDICFVTHEQIGARPLSDEPFEGAPRLAIDVISLTDLHSVMRRKVEVYLDSGACRAWLVSPESKEITIYRPGGRPQVAIVGETLTSEHAGFAVDGFSLQLGSPFA